MNAFFRLLLTTLVLLLATLPGQAGFRVRTVQLDGTTYLLARDVAGYYDLSHRLSGTSLTMTSKTHTLRFTLDRREAQVDGTTLNLALSPQNWRGAGVISEKDLRLTLDPILRPAALPKTRVRTIVIDPGHGGKDQGTSGRKYLEKDLTLRVSRMLADTLRRQGYTVYLTRSSDVQVALEQRPLIPDRVRGDLFVSIHANSAADRGINGIETFMVAPQGTASTYDTRVWSSKKRGNQFDKYNTRLAYDVHRLLIQNSGAPDRGIKHANFLVLRDAGCPAILVEIGFLSNAAEEARLGTTAYQVKLVAGLAAGIRAYDQAVGATAKSRSSSR